ncbi:hypothetical protein AVEN_175666-1 [Araneus ventricosus]|uniref:Reverse transcriptase domain-containing protein n=1 Tax=Araneus ventricosus TaxID=182803 RepID=A0A4Y2SPW5_ARAVE|nr:hypothetical protein AVEN_175666-1 [Araneus ventricosus]
MWDNVRRECGIYPEKRITCLRKNDQEVRNISEMVDVLPKAFASICSASNYTEPPFLTHKNRTERIKLRFQTTKHISYNTDLTIFELHTALSVLKHTSPGPDEVTYSILQHLSEHSLLNILYMFNRIWKEHVFPDCWKHAFIIPIPKPGKDPQDPLNYRPIALTSCMCKLFERIVNVRLVHILEKNEYISPFQSGFRKSRSTIHNLMSLETDIHVAFLQTVSKSPITTVTALSIALSFPACTIDERIVVPRRLSALRSHALVRLVVTSHGDIEHILAEQLEYPPFIIRCIIVFCLLLAVLSSVISSLTQLAPYHLRRNISKLVGSVCYIALIAIISTSIALFCENF